MVEKLISSMDENYEGTKNESRDSKIGSLQEKLIEIYPDLRKYAESFFWKKEYFVGENVDVQALEKGEQVFNNLENMVNENGIQKAA